MFLKLEVLVVLNVCCSQIHITSQTKRHTEYYGSQNQFNRTNLYRRCIYNHATAEKEAFWKRSKYASSVKGQPGGVLLWIIQGNIRRLWVSAFDKIHFSSCCCFYLCVQFVYYDVNALNTVHCDLSICCLCLLFCCLAVWCVVCLIRDMQFRDSRWIVKYESLTKRTVCVWELPP